MVLKDFTLTFSDCRISQVILIFAGPACASYQKDDETGHIIDLLCEFGRQKKCSWLHSYMFYEKQKGSRCKNGFSFY